MAETKDNTLRTQEQKRMAHAWASVSKITGQQNSKLAKDYRSLVRQAAADVMTSGLGQTVAFWRSKIDERKHNGEEQKAVYESVDSWLRAQLNLTKSLHEWIVAEGTTTVTYMRATRETIAYLVWLKRFAEGEIKVD
ncbi:MAG: type III-B CRISPR module-associated protein Cmr5 [Anaerolineae bacterium]|nr:type III-B CRISPR module-associated protein Cmr5 [Anaerolineae bacterium]